METFLKEILPNLESNQPIQIINALKEINTLKDENQLTPEIVAFLYPVLTKSLVHNNYKIRLLSFKLVSHFLNSFPEYIANSSIAFGNVVTSLASVNKNVVDYANKCAEIIMNIEEPRLWWPELESRLKNSRSTAQKLCILELLLDHTDEIRYSETENDNIIPVQVLCKCLTDPAIQIQRKAMQILDKVKKDEVNTSLNAAEEQLGMNKSQNEMSFDALAKVHQRTLRTRAKQANEQPISNPGGANSRDQLNSSRKSITSHKSSKSLSSKNDGGSIKSSTSCNSMSSTKSNREQNSLAPSKSNMSNHFGASVKTSAFRQSISNAKSNLSAQLHSSRVENSSQNCTESQINNSYRSRKSRNSSKKPIETLENHDYQQLSESDTCSEIKSQNFLSDSDDSVISSHKSYESQSSKAIESSKRDSNIKENIGNLPQLQPVRMAMKLEDLTKMKWTQKYSYLQTLEEEVNKPGRLPYPPDQIIDCVLTGAFPISKQVAPLISKILADLLPQNPELISVFANDLMQFILLGIRLLNDGQAFAPLTEVIFLEGDENDIIDAAISIANNEKRSLHVETFLLPLFEKKKIILEKSTLFNLLCYLVHRAYQEDRLVAEKQPEHFNNVSSLLSYMVSRQRNLYLEFMKIQTAEAKDILEGYVQAGDNVSATDQKIHKSSVVHNPFDTIKKEFKKGDQANLSLVVEAINQIDFSVMRSIEIFFRDVLRFLSCLSEDKIQRHIPEIRSICSPFEVPAILSIINSDQIIPDLVYGAAIFVWNCPVSALERSDLFYPRLYSIFKSSKGDIREQIILIEMAIRRATNVSITSLDCIPEIHKKLITKMENQFKISRQS